MKYLKLFENFKIQKICKNYGIQNYTINKDGSIDVEGDVNLFNKILDKLPLKFRNVSGDFDCSYNQLTSLENCPKSVDGDFDCDSNRLNSLKFSPEYVLGEFNCKNNQITSLKFMPKCDYFYCSDNKISEFKYFIEPVKNYISCYNNPIDEIWRLFKNSSYIELFNEYDCIRGKDIVIDRLNQFLEEVDKPTVKSVKGYNNI